MSVKWPLRLGGLALLLGWWLTWSLNPLVVLVVAVLLVLIPNPIWILAIDGVLVFLVFPIFLAVIAVVSAAIVSGGNYLLYLKEGDTEAVQKAYQHRAAGIDEVASFAQTVTRLQAAQSVNARLRLALLAEQYQSGLQHLEARGELTPAVEAEFRALAEAAGRSITGLAMDFSRDLPQLINAYSGNRAQLRAARRQLGL